MMYCKCRRHLSFDILLFLAICIGGNTPLWAQSRLDSIQQLDEVVVTAKSYKEVMGQRISPVGKLSFKRIA